MFFVIPGQNYLYLEADKGEFGLTKLPGEYYVMILHKKLKLILCLCCVCDWILLHDDVIGYLYQKAYLMWTWIS